MPIERLANATKYYIYTKDPLPMDVDFLLQDTYSLTRPQWKIAADLEEATRLFGEAVAQNYKLQDADKNAEPEEEDLESIGSDDGLEEDVVPEAEEDQSSSEEAEVGHLLILVRYPVLIGHQASGANAEQNGDSESEDEEQIFVKRQEEERDPEAEAEFDREFEKIMAESMDSRRFERKAMFDVPLPMKRPAREPSATDNPEEPQATPSTMAFSLMTKRGNRQQVCVNVVAGQLDPWLTCCRLGRLIYPRILALRLR